MLKKNKDVRPNKTYEMNSAETLQEGWFIPKYLDISPKTGVEFNIRRVLKESIRYSLILFGLLTNSGKKLSESNLKSKKTTVVKNNNGYSLIKRFLYTTKSH